MRKDWVDSSDMVGKNESVTQETPYVHTIIMTGDFQKDEGDLFESGSGTRSGMIARGKVLKLHPTFLPPWDRIVGLHMRIKNAIILATVDNSLLSEFKGLGSPAVLAPDPKRVAVFIAGEDTGGWFVENVASHGDRLAYTYEESGNPILQIVLSASNPWHVFDQRILNDDGSVSVSVVSDGFESRYVPHERVIVSIDEDGSEVKEYMLILNSTIPAQFDDDVFAFRAPDGYYIQEAGPDGVGISAGREVAEGSGVTVADPAAWTSRSRSLLTVAFVALIALILLPRLIGWMRRQQ